MSAIAKIRSNELAALLTEVAIDDAKEIQAMRRAKEFPPGALGIGEMMRMMQLTDAELQAAGWTRTDLNIAMGANMNSKEAPLYLKVVADRFALRFRDGAGEKPSKAARVVMPVQINNYGDTSKAPTITLGRDDK